jgi:hypothetical protein
MWMGNESDEECSMLKRERRALPFLQEYMARQAPEARIECLIKIVNGQIYRPREPPATQRFTRKVSHVSPILLIDMRKPLEKSCWTRVPAALF